MSAGDLHPLSVLIDEILRTRGRLVTATPALGAEEGLTGSQSLVLAAVIRAVQPPTVPQIGRSLGHTRQAVQRTADALAQRGLIEFVDNPDHKRARRLVPTERGRAVDEDVQDRSRVWADRVTEGMDPGDLVAATETLRTLRTRLEAEGAGRTPDRGAGPEPR
ncbi:MarR family transcriptional regulator [Peterkaempfera bronchialis]|uniref:MarR family transcriptional regulator n=2 Tax=Peterkaempfera bronchialis TaxID=2126346 RepID=A0A345SR43_9ACTN|nr:MarR family transcriptional regulator [Peterkaempfera bronchialis]